MLAMVLGINIREFTDYQITSVLLRKLTGHFLVDISVNLVAAAENSRPMIKFYILASKAIPSSLKLVKVFRIISASRPAA